MTARSLLERAPILHFDNHLCPVFELYIICGRENDGTRRIDAAIRAQGYALHPIHALADANTHRWSQASRGRASIPIPGSLRVGIRGGVWREIREYGLHRGATRRRAAASDRR